MLHAKAAPGFPLSAMKVTRVLCFSRTEMEYNYLIANKPN